MMYDAIITDATTGFIAPPPNGCCKLYLENTSIENLQINYATLHSLTRRGYVNPMRGRSFVNDGQNDPYFTDSNYNIYMFARTQPDRLSSIVYRLEADIDYWACEIEEEYFQAFLNGQ